MSTRKKYQTPEIHIANMSSEGMLCESYGEDQGSWSNVSLMDAEEIDPLQ